MREEMVVRCKQAVIKANIVGQYCIHLPPVRINLKVLQSKRLRVKLRIFGVHMSELAVECAIFCKYLITVSGTRSQHATLTCRQKRRMLLVKLLTTRGGPASMRQFLTTQNLFGASNIATAKKK